MFDDICKALVEICHCVMYLFLSLQDLLLEGRHENDLCCNQRSHGNQFKR